MNSTSVIKIVSVALLATVMMGCSEKEDKKTKNSSDFATSAIEAHYLVEISEKNNVIYQANFIHDKNSLKLDGGDVISIETNGESIALGESIVSGKATYRSNRTETQVASRYFFEFIRATQADADGSYVKVPDGFNLVSPTDGVANYIPSGGTSFTINWRELDSSLPAADDDEVFTLLYEFTCRNDSGTPVIEKSYNETVDDDGSHVVDLAKILGAGDYDECKRFDITAIRRDAKGGVLDSALKSGSTVGTQVRTVKGSLDGLQLQ